MDILLIKIEVSSRKTDLINMWCILIFLSSFLQIYFYYLWTCIHFYIYLLIILFTSGCTGSLLLLRAFSRCRASHCGELLLVVASLVAEYRL